MQNSFPVGKLPVELLNQLIQKAPVFDQRLVLGPGVGLDCAVVDMGPTMLAFKTDPITFATEEIGWYLVQINTNDIVTTGAEPRWLMATILLPQGEATQALVEKITNQIYAACREARITFLGGHTEITAGLNRPIVIGTMVGEVSKERFVSPRNAQPGDQVLLTKGVPVETTAILAREFPERCRKVLSEEELVRAQNFLFDPGIGIRRDAEVALQAGRVTAMHDPTEGGLATALWELSEACGHGFFFEPEAVYVPSISARLCAEFSLNPLDTIASGALLMTVAAGHASRIQDALEKENIRCMVIGRVDEGPVGVRQMVENELVPLPRPDRDQIATVFE